MRGIVLPEPLNPSYVLGFRQGELGHLDAMIYAEPSEEEKLAKRMEKMERGAGDTDRVE